jgi:hypothetical protein
VDGVEELLRLEEASSTAIVDVQPLDRS